MIDAGPNTDDQAWESVYKDDYGHNATTAISTTCSERSMPTRNSRPATPAPLRSRWLLTGLAAAALIIAGCSDDGPTANPTTITTGPSATQPPTTQRGPLSMADGVALPTDGPGGSMEDFIVGEMAASGVPGVAYAVVDDGENTSADAHGVVRAGGRTEVTPDTPFVIGSISKSFTALAVMQLVESGAVDLDNELAPYLDGFSGRPAGAVTIRQLLSHTSGFSTLQGNASTSGTDELSHRVDELAAAEPAYEPGERWEYSNTNYQILGRLIEVVSGQDYQTYVAANILEPVGMTHSFVADGEIHEPMATGHRPWFGTKRPLAANTTDRVTAPQGGIVASSHDLARYMQMMMNDADDVLSAEGKVLMMQPASTTSPHYGFGWYLDPANRRVWHSGSTPGVETLLTMLPTQNEGAVVLVNGGSGLGFGETTELLNGTTARALNLDYDGEGSRWVQKSVFVSLVLLPIIYVLSMIWAWRRRAEIRAKSGVFGLFSWWFPLFTTLASAWVILWLIPNLFDVPLSTLALFQPDLGLALIATALFGVLWAVFRLGVAYTGQRASDGLRGGLA